MSAHVYESAENVRTRLWKCRKCPHTFMKVQKMSATFWIYESAENVRTRLWKCAENVRTRLQKVQKMSAHVYESAENVRTRL